MKNTIFAALALAAASSAALASDLPARTPAAAPVAASSAFGLNGFYFGGQVGGNFAKFNDVTLGGIPGVVGVTAGYEWNKYARTEVTVDYVAKNSPVNPQSGQAVFANLVGQYPLAGTGFTPYILAGTGFGWNSFGNGPDRSFTDEARALYNVGGGVRYTLTKNFELDGRYRYINSWEGSKIENSSVGTIGLNYKF